MPALFAALEDKLSDAVDAHFGEQFAFLPMVQPTVNSRLGADPDRTGVTLTAVIDDRSANASFARLGATSAGHAGTGGPPHFTTTAPMLFLDERRLGGRTVRRHDRWRRIGTGDIYETTNIEQDGQGRLKLALVKVAKEAPG